MFFGSFTETFLWRFGSPRARPIGDRQQDVFHPSLHFKKLRNENWSVRIGLNYRALGKFSEDGVFLWEWIGSHADYDKRV